MTYHKLIACLSGVYKNQNYWRFCTELNVCMHGILCSSLLRSYNTLYTYAVCCYGTHMHPPVIAVALPEIMFM